MATKADLITQLKAENPTMTATINGESIELSKAEYEKACSDWADMQLAKQAAELEAAKEAAALKTVTAKLAALGLTTADLQALGL